jgi:uncharacterized membrane protein
MGPLEYVVLGFPGEEFKEEFVQELNAVREKGLIRLVDLVFVSKDMGGLVETKEASDLTGEMAERLRPLSTDILPLLTGEDLEAVAEGMPEGTSAVVMLFEHAWAIKLKQAIEDAGGQLLSQGRVAPEALANLEEELAADREAVGARR